MSGRPSVFPSIIPDGDDEFVDDSYGEQELARKDYDELRSIAADHPDGDVHGRMGKEDLRDALEGKKRVSDQ